MVEAKLEQLVNRLEKAVERQEAIASSGGGATGGSSGATVSIPKVIRDYVKAMEPKIADMRAKTADLGNAYVTATSETYFILIHQQALTMMAK